MLPPKFLNCTTPKCYEQLSVISLGDSRNRHALASLKIPFPFTPHPPGACFFFNDNFVQILNHLY